MTVDIDKIKERLSAILPPNRYQHSLGTAEEAAKLAERWGVDTDKAYLAGLLHDNMKSRPAGQLLSLAKLYNIKIDDWMTAHPSILHGPVAAAMLAGDWGINDSEIAEAIRLHTIPEANMTDLAKIIYLADKIEPNRKTWDGLEHIRALAYQDLDKAMEAMLRSSIEFLANGTKKVHPATQEIWQTYRNKIADKK